MAKATRGQRKTVGRVMHEWKHGELESSRGGKVRSRRQAVAIALSEAGESRKQTRGQKRRQYARTKSKERRGQTAMQQKEGRRSTTRTGRSAQTRAQLYEKAKKRKIPGRSHMTKDQLQRALRR